MGNKKKQNSLEIDIKSLKKQLPGKQGISFNVFFFFRMFLSRPKIFNLVDVKDQMLSSLGHLLGNPQPNRSRNVDVNGGPMFQLRTDRQNDCTFFGWIRIRIVFGRKTVGRTFVHSVKNNSEFFVFNFCCEIKVLTGKRKVARFIGPFQANSGPFQVNRNFNLGVTWKKSLEDDFKYWFGLKSSCMDVCNAFFS